jgi:cellobiose-specific phosphotransferase system component IIC
MATLATFLIGIAGSLAARVFLALGISIVSYAALTTAVSGIITTLHTSYDAMPVTTLQLANLGGMGEFLAIITAAIVARVSLMVLKRFRVT